ncbi:hypothetical protein WKW80_35785 [Variovorax humicola]|uniref:Uncharacterized protein n=1 Tax=Variovorax humicola TaxID=1769758 RepID=A0ABU8WCN9_9BURK
MFIGPARPFVDADQGNASPRAGPAPVAMIDVQRKLHRMRPRLTQINGARKVTSYRRSLAEWSCSR